MQRINEKKINEKKIQEEHCSAGNEIVYSHFNPPSISGVSAHKKRWTILFAEMQSGKTGTFLFVSFEMLIKKMVDKVIIFSGNRETGLRTQTEDGVGEFVDKFRRHLRTDPVFGHLSEDERNEELEEIVNKIHVVWGSDLGDTDISPIISSNTLFVFEESHFAQNIGMQADKFLAKVGISATGEGLEKSDNYVLSVSATPISELSVFAHDAQTKGLVYLKPGPGYFGLSAMRENGNIVGYDVSDWKHRLDSAIQTVNREDGFDGFKYALVRLTKKKSSKKSGAGGRRRREDNDDDEEEDTDAVEEAKAIAREHNWDICFHDSIPHSQERKQINIQNPKTKDTKKMKKLNPLGLKDLNDVPERHTLVFLKGKCRMGQVVPKQHISFVMETSQKPNTDVVLQSLLGRMCGYDANRNVIIYLSNKILNSDEFENYLAMVQKISAKKKITVLPNKARNIKPLKRRQSGGSCSDEDGEDKEGLHGIIPLRFPGLALSQDGQSIIDKIEIKQKIWEHFNGNNVQDCENLNSPEQYQDIQTTIIEENDGFAGFRVSRVNGNHTKTYHLLPEKYRQAFDTYSVPTLPPACAPNRTGVIPRLFIFGDGLDNYHGFEKGDVFLDIRISTGPIVAAGGGDSDKYSPAELKRIPTTNRRETFSHKLETGATTTVNGGMLLGLKPETHCNVELMYRALREFIELSLQPQADDSGVIYPRRINTVINHGGESTGIFMTQEVCDAVHPDGDVFNRLRAEFGVELVVTFKMKKEKNVVGMKKSIEISW